MSAVVTPAEAAVELDVPLTEWALKISMYISALVKYALSHLAMVLPVTGSCFRIQDKNNKNSLFSVDQALN